MIDGIKKTRVVFERHPDDDWYDEVLVETVERWKESELSGDEYRFSYYVQFKRKGQVLVGRGFSRFSWAMAHVPSLALNDYPGGADEEHKDADVIVNRYAYCFQPGCPEKATREFRILRLYGLRSGDPAYMGTDSDYRFRFCQRHGNSRGDCGLMDADANLVEVAFGSAADAPALGAE